MSIWVLALTCGFVHANSDFSTSITTLYCSLPSSVVFGCKTATLGPDLQVCMGSRPHLSFCACKTAWLTPEWLVSMGPCPHLWLLHAKQRILVQSTSLYGYQTSLIVLCVQNGVIYTRMTSLHWFQPSSVVLCLQNSDFKTRLTSLYGSQSSSVVLSTHKSVLSTDYMGSSPHLWFWVCKTATLGLELHVSMGPRRHLLFSVCWTACVASELLVSMGPSPHLWFLHAKQRLLDPNSKSLWFPDITCHFVPAIQRD